MKKQDNLRLFMKDLPREEPSADFTRLVMERVRVEAVRPPVIYQPLINKQLWIRILFGFVLFLIGAIVLRNYFPGNDNPVLTPSFYQIDLSFMLKPFQMLSNALNNVSLSYILGMAAISVLLFADQVYSWITEQ